MANEEEMRKRVVAESLGWLTESTIMPKKHKSIEGVGASSIMELKAELYKSQEESKKSKDLSGADVDYHRAKKKITPNDAFSRKNSGVDARANQYLLLLLFSNVFVYECFRLFCFDAHVGLFFYFYFF